MRDNTAMSTAMTVRERSELCSLVRQRERLHKTQAKQRSAELLADFEHQLGSIYEWDQDATWKAAAEAAQQAVNHASAAIADRCKQLGNPKEFAPGVSFGWYGRGQNAMKARREELRRMAVTRIAALEMAARTQSEEHSVKLQEQIVAAGITSEAAHA